MENQDLILLTESIERGKSNTHQINEMKEEIKEIRKDQKAIYDLTSSVKLIAQDMSSIKETVNEVKDGQKVLENKMDEQITDVQEKIKAVDSKSKVDFLEFVKGKILPFTFGGGIIGAILKLVDYFNK